MTFTMAHIPEKARLLDRLQQGRFNVPAFIYVPAEDFIAGRLDALSAFFERVGRSFKVIARSAHPDEELFRGGTFDSLETYADIAGVLYARKRMIDSAQTVKRLSIVRQQKFNHSPDIDPRQMGVIVMPFIEGMGVMAKKVDGQWEFGYCLPRGGPESRTWITRKPHDVKLLSLSESIEDYLGFSCEIEYVAPDDGSLHVVQAKDISKIETLHSDHTLGALRMDGLRRIRKRRNFRERPIYLMDNETFYADLIAGCLKQTPTACSENHFVSRIGDYAADLEDFALRYERFAVFGICMKAADATLRNVYHFLCPPSETGNLAKTKLDRLSVLIDAFLAEADTLILPEQMHLHLCCHAAYGIDAVRNPKWIVFWHEARSAVVMNEIRRIGFKTGDSVAIHVDADDIPTIYRL